MSSAPVVSVIIPCHNHGRYLRDALDSLHAQTFRDFEILIVDDGSTDADSLSALAEIEHEATRVIRTSNHGVIVARNTAIAAARGRYILPLDADDKIGNRYLELAVPVLEANPAMGIVYCKAEFFGEQSGPWNLPAYRFPDILIGNVIFNCALFRREDWEAVGGFNPNMHEGWEDFDFWVSIIELGRDVHQLPETLFYYRITAKSRNAQMQESSSRYARAYTQIYRNHPALYDQHIDVVFNELIRLWDVVAHKNQQLHDLTHKLNALAAAYKQLQQQGGTPAAPAPAETAPTPLLKRLWRAVRG